MEHPSLWIFYLRDGADTLHWRPDCVRCLHPPPGSRMIELDQAWQQTENLISRPPATVIERALQLFRSQVCIECIPTNVLDRLPAQIPRTQPLALTASRFPRLRGSDLHRYRGQLVAMKERLADSGHPELAENAAELHDALGELLDDRRRKRG